MSDDYLWDRSGPPDPEVARLEELLRPLGRQDVTADRLELGATDRPRTSGRAHLASGPSSARPELVVPRPGSGRP